MVEIINNFRVLLSDSLLINQISNPFAQARIFIASIESFMSDSPFKDEVAKDVLLNVKTILQANSWPPSNL